MYRSGAAVVFWFLFMMNTSANALAASEASNSKLPQLQPPDPNKKLPPIKLGGTIQFKELDPIILGSNDDEVLRSEAVLANSWTTTKSHLLLFVCLLVP
jgi:hypothetical protein